jgi:hypothetical protein
VGLRCELCLIIIGPSQVGSPLSMRMQAAALRHARVVGELAALWVAVSSVAKLVIGRSPGETSVECMNKLTAKFWRLKE